MKAVAYLQPLPIDHIDALLDADLPEPEPTGHDLRVRVAAVSVNPVDTKIRRGAKPAAGQPKVLGWDAVGVVQAVGAQVSMFKPGDRVWYAGAIHRAGANAQLHVVDERIAALAPTSLPDDDAAAMPLTAITAWEMLFHRLGVAMQVQTDAPVGDTPPKQSLLIVGAAGGVGSIMIQLARQLTGLTVIATASRPETVAWVRELGAHHVLDHSKPLAEELKAAGLPAPTHVVSLTQTGQHFAQITELIAPQGRFGLIDDPAPGSIDITLLKRKSVSLHWELMFTRSLFETADMNEQHLLLTEVARLVDQGRLRSTRGEYFGTINAANLRRAHALLESGKAVGKVVLSGF